ncbi:MAG: hypothetical protein HC880_13535 [Bacteroidia bacterium]|nr:hypothetical protein [Bacteroidia bacterium]
MVFFDSPYLIIQYNEELKALTEEWKLDFTTRVEADTFRQPLESLIWAFRERKATKWLCDNTEQKILNSKDQLWLETYYYPQLVQNGLRTVALINAKNILGTDYAKNCLQSLNDQTIKIEVFNKNKDGRSWLSSQE